jgi:hypothetical protein
VRYVIQTGGRKHIHEGLGGVVACLPACLLVFLSSYSIWASGGAQASGGRNEMNGSLSQEVTLGARCSLILPPS